MTTFTKILLVDDCKDLDIIKRRIPDIEHFKFVLELNSELVEKLPEEPLKFFTQKALGVTARNIFSQLLLRGLIYQRVTRVDTSETTSIIQAISKKSDPCIQILKENLSVEVFLGISTLICTKILHTPPSSLFTLKLQLSC